ncbi:hypothetical protein [Bacillus sp. TL12]|uniref:hypothetical protein n=1 Tax=Bacillus sp. TL12 TaxID=2894756 RepID=UPI001F52009E|nr:hypothetical protein [Bacillus sp. TL12]
MISLRDIQFINIWLSQMKHYRGRDKKQKAEKAQNILKLKYKMIGYGENRIVYDLNNKYVLKIAITRWGLRSNKTEFEIYKNCPPELREHLCPVKKFGFGWIIMKKFSLKVPENEIYNEKLSQLKNRFLKTGIIPEDIYWYNEPNMNNMMLSEKDKIIIIDYGDFKRTSSI